MPTREQLMGALRQADANGDDVAAKRFAEMIKESDKPDDDGGSPILGAINTVASFLPSTRVMQEVVGREKLEGLQRAAADGALLGFGDESEAVLESLFTDKTYKQSRDAIRDQKEAFAKENPKANLAAQVGGGLITGGSGLTKTLGVAGAKTVLGKAAVGAVTGGTLGAVTGAGNSKAELTGEDADLGALASDTAKGGAIGAVAGGILAGAGGLIGNYVGRKAAKNDQLANILSSNPKDSRVAKYFVDGAGKVKNDVKATEAIRQGFDDGIVSVAKAANKADKAAMRKMVNTVIKGRRDPTKALRDRPANVLGESISKRYKFVTDLNKKAGNDIEKAAKSLANIDAGQNQVINSFKQQLDDLGVKTAGKSLSFKGSDFESFGASKTLINRVFQKASKVKDAKDAHELKRFIDRFINYGKSNQKAPDKEALQLIGDFRRGLDDALDGFSAQYDKANNMYGQTIKALGSVDDLIGKASSSGSANFDKTLGTLARRMSSNAMSGGRVDDSLLELNKIANANGGKFSDDFDTLVVFANELERRLGTTARTSLQGVQENVAQRAAGAIDKGAAKTALDKSSQLTNKVRGISEVNDENALIAIRKLLTSKTP